MAYSTSSHPSYARGRESFYDLSIRGEDAVDDTVSSIVSLLEPWNSVENKAFAQGWLDEHGAAKKTCGASGQLCVVVHEQPCKKASTGVSRTKPTGDRT